LQDGHYQEIHLDAARTVSSGVTGLLLGIRDGWLRWLTAEGVVLPTPRELAEQERQRAVQEHQRAEQAHRQATEALERAAQAEQLLAAYRHRFGNLEEH
jgi:hypothetical protein